MLRGLLFASVFLVFSCTSASETSPGIRMNWVITPDPPQTGRATLVFELTDSTASPIQAYNLRMEANMTHPGMQPVFADVRENASGKYEAEFEFTMPGDWYILIDGELPGDQSFQKQIDVPGVRSSPAEE